MKQAHIQSLLDAGDVVLCFDSRRAGVHFPRVDLRACLQGYQGLVVGPAGITALMEREKDEPTVVDIPLDAIYAAEDHEGGLHIWWESVPEDHPDLFEQKHQGLRIC